MSENLIGWFKAEHATLVRGDRCFVGPSPFSFMNDTEGLRPFFNRPWVISFDESTQDKLWKVIGVERHCTCSVSQGQPICLVVRPAEITDPITPNP